jgi:deoxyribonuclease-4
MGMDAMKSFAMPPVTPKLPFILETPNDDKGYMEEIAIVNSWMS